MSKAIKGLTTAPKKLIKSKSGFYVVEVTTDQAAKVLLETKSMANQPVDVTPHRSHNTSRGVIVSKFLEGASDDDLLDDLKNQGVTRVRRILRNRRHPTNAIVLTFDTPTPKDKVLLLHLALDVNPYIAPPMRCFKCQKFGHVSSKCKKKDATCSKCSGEHPEADCQSTTLKCANCKENHSAYDKTCPKYIEIKNVLEISAKRCISIRDAKKELTAQKAATYVKAAHKDVSGDVKPNTHTHEAPNTNDKVELLRVTILEQEKNHKAEIAKLKATYLDTNKAHKAELRERDEIIIEQEQNIQQLTVTLDTERTRKPASVQQMELLKAQLVQQQKVSERQEETIRELQSLVTKLEKKLDEKTATESKPEEKKEDKNTKESKTSSKIVSPSFKPIASSQIPRAAKKTTSKCVKPDPSALPTQAGKLKKGSKPASSAPKNDSRPAIKSTEKTTSKTEVICKDGAASNFSPPNLRKKTSTKTQDGWTVQGK